MTTSRAPKTLGDLEMLIDSKITSYEVNRATQICHNRTLGCGPCATLASRARSEAACAGFDLRHQRKKDRHGGSARARVL